MTQPLTGAVATVLSPRELVINIGAEAGVQTGMKFAVLNPMGIAITDPETDEPLGSVPIPKVIVEITRVEPKLSVGRTFKKRRRNVGGQGLGALGMAGVTNLFEPPKWVDEWETLRTEQKPEVAELDPEQSYVKRGDPVEQVMGDEFDTSEQLQ